MDKNNGFRPTAVEDRPGKESVWLMFRQGGRASRRAFYLRGGIAWPEQCGHRLEGYAVLVGQDAVTGKRYVFEEYPFVTVNHVIQQNALKHEGLCSFFSTCWSSYRAKTFFWNDYYESFLRYANQIYNNGLVQPTPYMPEVRWEDERSAFHAIWEGLANGNIKIVQGELARSVEQMKLAPDSKKPPAFRALMACIYGMDETAVGCG